MGALLNLADGPDAQLLQGLVIQLAAVVIAHARTRPDHHHKVNLLVNGLVVAGILLAGQGREPCASRFGGGKFVHELAPEGAIVDLDRVSGRWVEPVMWVGDLVADARSEVGGTLQPPAEL
jgi:hypothetical protein